MKYDSSKKGFVPGFAKQKSVTGTYVGADNSRTNPLADDQLMSKRSGDSYGGYESFSIGQRPGYKKPNPSVQDNGRETK
jgi:hypothetical protein